MNTDEINDASSLFGTQVFSISELHQYIEFSDWLKVTLLFRQLILCIDVCFPPQLTPRGC